jgi:sigma-B regulation protein RsbU (phosphoserine phosphatase)
MAWLIVALALAAATFWAWRDNKLLKKISILEKKLERLRSERKSLLTMMHDLGEAFNADLTPTDLLKIVTATTADVLDASGCAYYRWNAETKLFTCISVYKIFPPLHPVPAETQPKLAARIEHLHEIMLKEKLPATNELFSYVLENGSLLIADAQADNRLPRHLEPVLRFRSLMLCRLSCQGQNYGVLAVCNKKDSMPFNRSDLELLEDISSQAAFSLHSAILLNIISEKRKLDQDVNLAGQIQRILLPSAAPSIPGYHIAGENIAAQRLSGDYYDFLSLPDGRLGLVIADVSGKGVAASLIMTMCRAVLRSHAASQSSPAQVLRLVNRQLQPDMQKDMFVTVIYAVLDPSNHTITLARAGHETPLLWRNGHVETIKSPGMAVGIDSGEMFDLFIQDVTLTLSPGDILLLYTDGVTEAQNTEQQEFGRDNLKQTLCTSAESGAKQTIENIINHISRFRGEAPAYDDITLIALQREPLPLNAVKNKSAAQNNHTASPCPAP